MEYILINVYTFGVFSLIMLTFLARSADKFQWDLALLALANGSVVALITVLLFISNSKIPA